MGPRRCMKAVNTPTERGSLKDKPVSPLMPTTSVDTPFTQYRESERNSKSSPIADSGTIPTLPGSLSLSADSTTPSASSSEHATHPVSSGLELGQLEFVNALLGYVSRLTAEKTQLENEVSQHVEENAALKEELKHWRAEAKVAHASKDTMAAHHEAEVVVLKQVIRQLHQALQDAMEDPVKDKDSVKEQVIVKQKDQDDNADSNSTSFKTEPAVPEIKLEQATNDVSSSSSSSFKALPTALEPLTIVTNIAPVARMVESPTSQASPYRHSSPLSSPTDSLFSVFNGPAVSIVPMVLTPIEISSTPAPATSTPSVARITRTSTSSPAPQRQLGSARRGIHITSYLPPWTNEHNGVYRYGRPARDRGLSRTTPLRYDLCRNYEIVGSHRCRRHNPLQGKYSNSGKRKREKDEVYEEVNRLERERRKRFAQDGPYAHMGAGGTYEPGGRLDHLGMLSR